ncbi:MAG: YkvA family protein [Betaproteobacteria bacterium]
MLESLKAWAARLKADVLALWFCYRHPDTPLIAKVVAATVVAYAFSPIDLIPDFIPVVGYLDDALLLPVGIWLAVKLIPPAVMAECRTQAANWLNDRQPNPRNRLVAIVIVLLWLALLWLAWRWAQPWLE